MIEIPVKEVKEVEQKVAAPGPKKRGRKKKIRPETIPIPPEPVPVPASKVYTVPKAQTYDNYLKYYDNILESTR